MCLVLATGPGQQVARAKRRTSLSFSSCFSPQLASWAIEAFFKYGGEPHFIFPTTMAPGSPSPVGLGSPGQPLTTPPPAPSPSVVGPSTQQVSGYGTAAQTPMASAPGALGRALVGPEVQRSGKHNGLCRYLARLLR